MLLSDPPKNHPRVQIRVAGCGKLRGEGIAYALLLRNAGIDTQLEVVPGVPHGINVFTKSFAAEQFFRNQARVWDAALHTEFWYGIAN